MFLVKQRYPLASSAVRSTRNSHYYYPLAIYQNSITNSLNPSPYLPAALLITALLITLVVLITAGIVHLPECAWHSYGISRGTVQK